MGERKKKKKNTFTSSSTEIMEKNMAGGRIWRYITTGEYNNITAAKRQRTASQQGRGGVRLSTNKEIVLWVRWREINGRWWRRSTAHVHTNTSIFQGGKREGVKSGEGVCHNFGKGGIHIRFRCCSIRQSQEASCFFFAFFSLKCSNPFPSSNS